MNTSEIRKQLNFLECFSGVYPRDKLPEVTNFPAAIVINTDDSSKPGEHWVSVYISKTGIGLYFDSYGLPPLHREIKNFLENSCKGWSYNKVLFQGLNSITWGHYCVLFVLLSCIGVSYEKFVTLFTTNTLLNDQIVQKLYKAIK
jgi:hypothetical protein